MPVHEPGTPPDAPVPLEFVRKKVSGGGRAA